jgi:hypothetical protein
MLRFSEKQLYEIYRTRVKKNPEYFKKYPELPACPVKQWGYEWKGHDMPRNFAILDFKEWVKKHNIAHGENLGLTGTLDPELEFINYKQHTLLNYPPYDLHQYFPKFKNQFNLFIFNQTIEHLYNPFMAIYNIFQYIKPGGYVYTTVPTINIPHMTPIHYNGYNPMGLAILFLSAGFEVIETGQWGNYDYISKLFKTHKWPDNVGNEKTGRARATPVNEERNVAQCWILAQKPKI